MTTPIFDFVCSHAASGTARFHMPGHKGRAILGCEPLDLTEIAGADSLYEASGIIAESEENAAALFGSGGTFYSTEGSSQCIRAMLYLALQSRPAGTPPVIAAARNVHKTFVYAAALLDFEPFWLWPEEGTGSLCASPLPPEALDQALSAMDTPPCAVYVTSPDYLGGMADIAGLAEVCRRWRTLLLVDNAHGAYLRFLEPSRHPLDLGADLCCDSAHKTLPVLTGGAYLHIGKNAPPEFRENAKAALALFGSTSPSYLTLASLDRCNAELAGDYPARLNLTVKRMDTLRKTLLESGWRLEGDDPLRLTLKAFSGLTGFALADRLRQGGVEPEYADRDYLVLMASPENRAEDFKKLSSVLGENRSPTSPAARLPLAKGERVMSIREALFCPHESIPVEEGLGRICGAPTVACPPAIPISISGERIGPEALALLQYYDIQKVDVLKF